MSVLNLGLDFVPHSSGTRIVSASRVELSLHRLPKKFFRHGWQSWTLSTWLDPSEPPSPIRSPEFRAKDEDPAYAFARNHVSAWVGAAELGANDILLLGALDLGGRVELDGSTLKAFYEGGHSGHWLIVRGNEEEAFVEYALHLEKKFGKTRFEKPPRVWCSWYSLYKWINEHVIMNALRALGSLPFDVFQLDDGWQITHGDWEATRKFPSGMENLAERIKVTGRTAGLWLAPLMVTKLSSIYRRHPDWLLKDERGDPVPVGLTWEGVPYALDSSHPAVLEWLDKLIRRVRAWGFDYLKLDYLYAGAIPGVRYRSIPRENAYRDALKVMREAAGNAYILACGAPIVPSLGLCDGIRVGPDVAPYWLNKPLSIWLNNPNETSTQNSIRTSLHRLWLNPLVNVDPDVMFFRSRHNALKPRERQLLLDLGTISNFKATSDLPQWMDHGDIDALRGFLEHKPDIRRLSRYVYLLDGREVDFSPVIPLPAPRNVPVWFAQNVGLLKILKHQVTPAVLESLKHHHKKRWIFYPLAASMSNFADLMESF